METQIQLTSTDDTTIYGKLITSETPGEKLIIHIHGLTHSQDSYLQLTSTPVFCEAGYDVFRFSFYDFLPKSRRLSTSTLTTHTQDLQTVIEHFAAQYSQIYLAAHSFGGLVTLILNPKNITAISLWDASLDVTHFWASGPYLTPLPERRAYILDYGAEYILSEDMVEEIKLYPHARCLELAKEMTTPTQMVIPEQSLFLASPHIDLAEYDAAFAGPYERVFIPKAGHRFVEYSANTTLFEHTLKWFGQHG